MEKNPVQWSWRRSYACTHIETIFSLLICPLYTRKNRWLTIFSIFQFYVCCFRFFFCFVNHSDVKKNENHVETWTCDKSKESEHLWHRKFQEDERKSDRAYRNQKNHNIFALMVWSNYICIYIYRCVCQCYVVVVFSLALCTDASTSFCRSFVIECHVFIA